MGIGSRLLQALTWWNGQTLNTALYTRRKGQKVGEDAQGNVYYQTADAVRRWVIYNGEMEASRISPEWHGWLHHTWDEVPSKAALKHKPWEKEHEPNHTGTPLAYAPAGSIRRASPADRSDYEAWSPE